MTTNADLFARRMAVMPSWLTTYYDPPISIERGEGCRVWDVEGTEYLDFFGGILTTMIGHNVLEVTDAIREQAGKVLHTSTLYLSEPAIELAERIAALSGIPNAKVWLTTSGTEANDAAILLATSYRRSNEVLAMRNSYHGKSFTAIALTSHRSWSPTSLSGLNVSFVQGGYRLRSPFRTFADAEFIDACVADLEQVIDMMTAGDVAALIAEPIQGVGGFATPPDGMFGAMKKVLDDHGILFISDEVQTGWGRTGEHFWGYQAHGIVPDILTFAKGVGNGITLGGVVARAEIMDSLRANHVSTFGGNPLSAAAGNATLQYVVDHDLQANALAMGTRLTEGLQPVVDRTPWIAELRGKGLMQAIEIVQPGGEAADKPRCAALSQAARDRGLLVGAGGLYGNVIRITPPLTVTAAEIDEAVAILTDAVAAVAS